MRGPAERRGGEQPARQAHTGAGPVDSRGVLRHVARRGHATTAHPDASARTSVPWPACVTTRSQAGIVRE